MFLPFTENSYGGRGVGVRLPVRIFPQYFYRLSSRRVRLFLGYGALISLDTIGLIQSSTCNFRCYLQLSTREAVVSNCQSLYLHRDNNHATSHSSSSTGTTETIQSVRATPGHRSLCLFNLDRLSRCVGAHIHMITPKDRVGHDMNLADHVAFWTGVRMSFGQIIQDTQRPPRKYSYQRWPVMIHDLISGQTITLNDIRRTAIWIDSNQTHDFYDG